MWLLGHVFLGFSITVSSVVVIAWLLGALLYLFNMVLRTPSSSAPWKIPLVLGYICGIELLARIANTSPFVPYEFAKYAFFILTITALLKFKRQKLSPGFWMLVLSLPGLVLIPPDGFRFLFVNSFLGIFILGLLAHLLHNQALYPEQLNALLRLILLGAVAVLAAVVFRSPNLNEIEFGLGANSDTTAGFGSNQVSTVLGMGFMVSAMAILLRLPLFPGKQTLTILALLFAFRALLTFSRGGILGALVAVLFAYLMPGSASKVRKIPVFRFMLIAAGFMLVFMAVDQLSGQMLSARYRGENYNTIKGQGEITANTATSGRSGLMEAEWNTFLDFPILGTGPGAGFAYREKYYGQSSASHTEVTRLLAEHGIPGLLIALIFLFFPVFQVLRFKTKRERMLATAFFTFAIFSSFHAAMRTTITPFFWALGCMRFPEEQSEPTQNQ